MARFVSVFLPHWSLDVLRRQLRSKGLFPPLHPLHPSHPLASPTSPSPLPPSTPHLASPLSPPARSVASRIAAAAASRQHSRKHATSAPLLMLSRTVSQRELVVACCPRCTHLGIRPGMTVAHAKALLPESFTHQPQSQTRSHIQPAASTHISRTYPRLVIRPSRPQRDNAALRSLAAWCTRMAPLVGVSHAACDATAPDPTSPDSTSADTLVMDISGCERLYPDPAALVRRIRITLQRRFGLACRVACAPTLAAARALARYSPLGETILTPCPGETSTAAIRRHTAQLPVASLNLVPRTLAALHEVGIHTVEHLLALPRRSIALRYGPATVTRIDHLFGDIAEPIVPIRPRPLPVSEHTFDGPVADLGIVIHTTRTLLQRLVTDLDLRHRGIRQLRVTIVRLDQAARTNTIHTLALARPSRSFRHLWSLLEGKLETTHLGFGIEHIALLATATGRIAPRTSTLQQTVSRPITDPAQAAPSPTPSSIPTLPPPDDSAIGELLDTLCTRMGPQHVLHAVPFSAHAPGRSAMFVPTTTNVPRSQFMAPVTPSPRPTITTDRPEPVNVMALVPDGPPITITWRSHSYRIIDWRGPELLSDARPGVTCWWSGPCHTAEADITSNDRDAPRQLLLPPDSQLFRAQLDTGLWLWLQRDTDPAAAADRWTVRGLWF